MGAVDATVAAGVGATVAVGAANGAVGAAVTPGAWLYSPRYKFIA